MTETIKSYRDLIAWRKAVALSVRLYRVTASFPKQEQYGLTNQLRRAGVSIPSNIAEGYGRGSKVEYARFLRIARGSLFEVETQLLIASQLGYVDTGIYDEVYEQSKECGRVLAGLIRGVEAGGDPG